MAEENSKENEKKPGLDIKIVLIGLLIFLVAMGASYFLMRSLMAPLYPESEKDQETEVLAGSLISAGEFTTNVGGTEGNHYLKVEVFIEVSDKKLQKSIEGYMPIVKDTILGAFSSASLSDLDIVNREKLKDELKEELNAKMGSNAINNVYFTNFILQ
ncbi:MAG: flagellar basal body-associated FliL family protein [Bacillota bacterium]|nr:flagellar basal body-associated FliL family protein [Bacillota bacterium]